MVVDSLMTAFTWNRLVIIKGGRGLLHKVDGDQGGGAVGAGREVAAKERCAYTV
jgi:hypothetical protein